MRKVYYDPKKITMIDVIENQKHPNIINKPSVEITFDNRETIIKYYETFEEAENYVKKLIENNLPLECLCYNK